VAGLAAELPIQAIHGDITDDNVVVDGLGQDDQLPDGIIDFGDLTHSWSIGELAVTVSAVLRHEGGEPAATCR
jgi:Ser/Thr protein kinase RdoA (MazF antagonist)